MFAFGGIPYRRSCTGNTETLATGGAVVHPSHDAAAQRRCRTHSTPVSKKRVHVVWKSMCRHRITFDLTVVKTNHFHYNCLSQECV